MSSKRPIYLDCDTGIDDSLAIAYLAAVPEIELVGIGTVSGNVGADQAARNTLDLLHLAGRDDVPVAVGAHHPLNGRFNGGVPHIHGHNGIGDIFLPPSSRVPIAGDAARLLLDLADIYAGSLEIVTVGPTTNIALALQRDATLPSRVRSVTTMGGAALVPGNISAVAEANIGNDPEAAAKLFEADWQATLVPLDVTLKNRLFEADRAALLGGGGLCAALGAMLDPYFDFYVPFYGERSSALHDPLAAAIAVGGVRATCAPAVPITIDATDGPGRGQTICDLRGQRLGPVDCQSVRTRVVLDTDRPLGPHLLDRLLRYRAPSGL